MKLNRWPRPHACFSLPAINAPIPSLPTINAPAPSFLCCTKLLKKNHIELLYLCTKLCWSRIDLLLSRTLLEEDQLATIWNSVGVRLSYYYVDLLTCHTCLLYMYPNILWCTLSKVLKIKQVCQVENNVYLLTCILSQVGISSLTKCQKGIGTPTI